MMVKSSNVIIIIGGILAVACLYLTWTSVSIYGYEIGSTDAWGFRDFLVEYGGEGFLTVMASYAPIVLIIFGIFASIEAILDTIRPAVYNEHYPIVVVLTGIVLAFFALMAVLKINDFGASLEIGVILGLIAGIAVIIGGIIAYKEEA